MENTKEEHKNNINENNINANINYSENSNRIENSLEKKAIIYLIILAILLIFFALFAIHYIVDRGVIKDTKSSTIIDPENNPTNPDNNGNNNSPVVDNNDRLRILEGAKEWSELKELGIFSNVRNDHVVPGKIAPGVSSIYNFTVENYGSTRKKYDINFIEENPYKVNLKYKIKLNGNYVAGDETTWVDYTALNQTNRIINANANDVYTIEWKWIDAENDTEVGETEGAYYKLYVKAYAEEVTNN